MTEKEVLNEIDESLDLYFMNEPKYDKKSKTMQLSLTKLTKFGK